MALGVLPLHTPHPPSCTCSLSVSLSLSLSLSCTTATMWKLANIEANIGLSLTSSYAMMPSASTSSLIFTHPHCKYFSLGKVARDQVGNTCPRTLSSLAHQLQGRQQAIA